MHSEFVNTRFTEIYLDPLHFIATVIDLCYNDLVCLLYVGMKQHAREMILAALDTGNLLSDREAHSAREGEQSSEKRAHLSAPDEILQESIPNNR